MNSKIRKYSPYFLLALSIIFISFGSYRGEVQTVIAKAIRICLECIGIG
ncbi:MAG: CD1871A family CXXC motif-containing protein [Peptoniphilus sp.]